MEKSKWKKYFNDEQYRFQLRMDNQEKVKFEALVAHFNTNKTLFLRNYINKAYEKTIGEKNG